MEEQITESRSAASIDTARRSTACLACQKQKVRCSMDSRQPPCKRCKKRRIECILRKDPSASSQSADNRVATAIVDDLKMLHSAVNELYAASSRAPLEPLRSMLVTSQPDKTPQEQSSPSPAYNMDAEILDEPVRHKTTAEGLVQVPMTSLYEITRLRSLRSKRLQSLSNEGTSTPVHKPRDMISRELISWDDANRLVRAYLEKPDHYLYGIASKFEDLDGIRGASDLLFTAICTVSALQDPSGLALYLICHAELRRLISTFVFTAQVNLEDLRGLCIACFWLSDISWPVSGLAIRRAVEFDLQKAFRRVIRSTNPESSFTSGFTPKASHESIEGVRLWYLFYICDQHLSILYGRPSTIRDEDCIRDWEAYLKVVQGESTDVRIVNQVALLLILKKVSELFGQDVEVRIPVIFKHQLDQFIHQLDQWVTTWLSRCTHHKQIGDYPSKAVTLHFYFAKLFVCSHVFRGLQSDVSIDPIPEPFKETAMVAVESAKSIIGLVLQDSDMGQAFIGMPHYFLTMIAFACSFLLKIATKYRGQVTVDVQAVFDMISRVVALCKESQCTQHHLVYWIGEGLQVLLSSCVNPPLQHDSSLRRPITDTVNLYSAPNNAGQLSSGPVGQNTLDAMHSLGSVWDTAREAAMLYPSDSLAHLYNFPYQMDSNMNVMDDNMLMASHTPDGTLAAPFFNMEQIGFGLL